MVKLFHDQETKVDEVWTRFQESQSVCLQAPTGWGKTEVFLKMASGCARNGLRVYIGVHTDELIGQVTERLETRGIKYGVIAAGYPDTSELLQVVSLPTLMRRRGRYPKPDFFIIDECHHVSARTWDETIQGSLAAGCLVLGVTATPERPDGKPLNKHFQTLVHGPQIAELVNEGRLARPIVYTIPSALNMTGVRISGHDYNRTDNERAARDADLIGHAVEHYQRICPGVQGIAFCVSVAHAQDCAEQFRAAGIEARCIDGTMSRFERREIVRAYRNGVVKILTNCQIAIEGFDVRGIRCVMCLRPTKSEIIVRQAWGRGLRWDEGKDEVYILDHAGWCAQFGLPDDERFWTLDGRVKKSILSLGPKITQCPKCYHTYKVGPTKCPRCGYEREVDDRLPTVGEGQLTLISDPKMLKRLEKEQAEQEAREVLSKLKKAAWGCTNVQQFIEICKKSGKPRGWARHYYSWVQQQKGAKDGNTKRAAK